MQLTTFTDYAFRLLIYLALDPERTATITEVSDYFGVSRHHMVKVVHRLGQGGFITTTRGKGGGLKLARKPADLKLGEVIRWMEPSLSLVECQHQGKEGRCRAAPSCRLNGILDRAMAAFLATLDRHSLADAIPPNGNSMARQDVISLPHANASPIAGKSK